MNFKHLYWEKHYTLSPQEALVVAVENPLTLWNYCTSLIAQTNGEAGFFSLSKNLAELSFDKICNVETNIPGFILNTKKIQTALIKKCAEFSSRPEFEETLRSISNSLIDFCRNVCRDIGHSISIDDDFDVTGLFKLFSVTLREAYDSLLDKLIEYININVEFSKTKVFFFLFLTKFLNQKEIEMFFEHCRFSDVAVVFLEDCYPNNFSDINIPYQCVIIDKDNCLIE